MKLLIALLISAVLLSCNNSKKEPVRKDTLALKADTLKNIIADTPGVVYCYIMGIDKNPDSIFLKADPADYHYGPNVVEEAKKMHRADTSYKNGKIEDIFVPDDYFIVNDDKQVTRYYLPKESLITMDSRLSGEEKNINTFDYFSKHYASSFFKIKVLNNRILSVDEVFLP